VSRVGRHDNFFELGGHSLAAMQIMGLMRTRHAAGVALQDFFEAPTLAQLSGRLGAKPEAKGESQRDLAAIEALLGEFEE
jgi:aryl carrier-like protein